MKKIIKAIATILCIGSIAFLAGEWPEDTPRNKVVAHDASALAVVLATGLYLKHSDNAGRR